MLGRRFLIFPVALILAAVATAQVPDSPPEIPPEPAAQKVPAETAAQEAPAEETTAVVPAEARHEDHEELRALLRTATEALNSRNFDQLDSILADRCEITTVDGQTFTSASEFKTYLRNLYSSKIKSIEFRPEADELTRFLGETTGLSRGSSTDTYTFDDGDVRTMKSRWTATLQKEDGRWKVVSLHVSANILENPVIEATRRWIWIAGGGGALAGLVIGFLLSAVIRRRSTGE